MGDESTRRLRTRAHERRLGVAIGDTGTVLRALSIAFALAAVVCMGAAIAGMVNGRQSPRAGYLLRLGALVCFAATVALNVAAH